MIINLLALKYYIWTFNNWKVTESRDCWLYVFWCPVALFLAFFKRLRASRLPSALGMTAEGGPAAHSGLGTLDLWDLHHARASRRTLTRVAPLSVRRCFMDGRPVGEHLWVKQFLYGSRRFPPPRQNHAAVWDLPLVLQALSEPPFKPTSDAALRVLSFKPAFHLTARTAAKRVGELHVISVSPSCPRWKAGVTLVPGIFFLPPTTWTWRLNWKPPPFASTADEGELDMSESSPATVCHGDAELSALGPTVCVLWWEG